MIGRAFGAAFSFGQGYEPQPLNHAWSNIGVRGYPLDLSAKTFASTAAIPSALEPAALAQLGLGWHQRWITGEADASARLVEVAALLERRGIPTAPEAMLWPYRVAVPKYDLQPPWYSAMAQGQAASLFVRAAVVAADNRFEALARAAVAPLLRPIAPGLVTMSEHGPVLQEAPGEPTSSILNGWFYALWGLWETGCVCGDDDALALFGSSIACLVEMLPRYDVGWWTRYDLRPDRLELAKPFYHRLHAAQAEATFRITGIERLKEAATRWSRYDSAHSRLRAVATKGWALTR